MTVNAIVTATDLRKSYGPARQRREALRGTSLRVGSGEWVAVVGPSGCGKSTLLHLLGGLDRPDSGSVRLGSDEVTTLRPAARAVLRRGRVGFVFQAYNLVPHLDVAANVELPLRVAGAGRRAARARAAEVLEALDLLDLRAARPAALSGGQQQRVAVARALAGRPDLLLADEPTGALDSSAARLVVDLLRAQNTQGQSIVMVTHDYAVAAEADRVVFLRDGQVTDERIVRPVEERAGAVRGDPERSDPDPSGGPAPDTGSVAPRPSLDDLLGLGHAW
ncbi:MAG: ABC transporter ATP-binding protein [Frankia sp.]